MNVIYQLYTMQKVQKSTFTLQSSHLITSSSKISRLFCLLCLLSPACQMSNVPPEPQQDPSEKYCTVVSSMEPPNASTSWPENSSCLRFLYSSTKQKNLLFELAPEWVFKVTWFRSAKTRWSLSATVWFIPTQQNEVSTLAAASLSRDDLKILYSSCSPIQCRAWYFNWLLVKKYLLACTPYSIYTGSLMVVLETETR